MKGGDSEHGYSASFEICGCCGGPKGLPGACDCAQVGSTWQPIETAPKDGTWVLGYFPELKRTIWVMRFDAPTSGHKPHWNVGSMTTADPTHWQPLPPPPQA